MLSGRSRSSCESAFDALAGEPRRLGLQEVRAVAVVDERFDRHAELAAVAERRLVMMGNAHRAGVVVEAFVERADLGRPLFLGDGAAANRVRAATRPRTALEHLAVVAELRELVGDHQPGESGAQHDNAGAVPAALQIEAILRGRGQKTQTGHRIVGHRHAACGGEPLEKRAPGQRH
jgi:hypothetical protein